MSSPQIEALYANEKRKKVDWDEVARNIHGEIMAGGITNPTKITGVVLGDSFSGVLNTSPKKLGASEHLRKSLLSTLNSLVEQLDTDDLYYLCTSITDLLEGSEEDERKD